MLRDTLHPDNITCNGPRAVEPYPARIEAIVTERRTLMDESRNASIDCIIRRPASAATAALPVVINSLPAPWRATEPSVSMSHVTRYLAAAGYAVVDVYHRSGDKRLFPVLAGEARGKGDYLRTRIADITSHHHRFLDIAMLIERLADLSSGGALKGPMDMSRIGIGGHSLGALTALSLGGLRWPPAFESYRHPGIKAAILYSNALQRSLASKTMMSGLSVPCLHMTGTRDRSIDGREGWREKLLAYHMAPSGDQYALILRGADHQTFGGQRADQLLANRREELCHQFIRCASLAFWDAYLKNSPQARDWLRHRLPSALGRDGSLEFR
ncbi:hypothetical protein [Iodidimonas sp. SYSU 1G8]|uniref:alpha/beta hydrolase family protein n=1 Tax=Iodidimonas sp. SYSU 1G8 TaxID=3133967 RepID=UPI0031FE566A